MNTRTPLHTVRLLHRSASALKKHLPSAISGDDTGVHQARVASRRLREAVPVLSTGLRGSKAGKARRKIRRLTQALGTVRELDVTLSLLDELAQMDGVPRAAVEAVRGRVLAERDEGRQAMLEHLEQLNVDKLHRRLDSVAGALEESDEDGWREALAARVNGRARHLADAVDAAGQMYSAERLHQVRIATKKLRYALEIAAAVGTASAAPLVRSLKRVQELLGRMHDLDVLLGHVAAVHATLEPGTGVSHHGLNKLAQHIEEECRHLHGRYLSGSIALRAIAETITRKVIPDIERPVRRRRVKSAVPRPVAAAASGRR